MRFFSYHHRDSRESRLGKSFRLSPSSITFSKAAGTNNEIAFVMQISIISDFNFHFIYTRAWNDGAHYKKLYAIEVNVMNKEDFHV